MSQTFPFDERKVWFIIFQNYPNHLRIIIYCTCFSEINQSNFDMIHDVVVKEDSENKNLYKMNMWFKQQEKLSRKQHLLRL